MNKRLKKSLKIFGITIGSLLLLIILAMILVPVFFKDDIQAALDAELKKNLDADVQLDIDKFDISLFSNFPDITISIQDFKVAGKGAFKGEVLADIKNFQLEMDLMSAISGDTMQLNGITLEEPKFNAIVKMVNGVEKANWDIVIPTDEQEEEEESPPLSLNIDKWEIINGTIIYDDRVGKMHTELAGLNHVGGGEIMGDIYKLKTETKIDKMTVEMDGMKYMNENEFESVFNLDMDMSDPKVMTMKFAENFIRLNKFKLHFDGSIDLKEESTDFNAFTFKADATKFEDIFSLVPGIEKLGVEKFNPKGSLAFQGKVDGPLTGEKVPHFGLVFKIKDGFAQAKEFMTEPIKNVNVDFSLANTDGVLDNTVFDLKKFHMDIGSNPIDAKAKLKGFVEMKELFVDANIKANLDLSNVMAMVPALKLGGINLDGLFNLNVKAKGNYSEEAGTMPKVEALMKFKDGLVKMVDAPELTAINIEATVLSDGSMQNTIVDVPTFGFRMDDEPFSGKLNLQNFENIAYEATLAGVLNLEKLMQLSPMPPMELKGNIILKQVYTKGDMLDLEAENFDALVATGGGSIENFYWKDTTVLPGFLDFEISKSDFTFDAEKININDFKGRIGKSDLGMNGYFGNYMGFLFSPIDTVLKGEIDFVSQSFDADEWMYEEPEVEGAEAIEEEEYVYPIPQFIDLVMHSQIGVAKYDGMDPTNLKGDVIIRNGNIILDGLTFDMLGAGFAMDMIFSTQDPKKPFMELDLGFQNMDIGKVFEYMDMASTFAPGADKFKGSFSSKLKMEYMLMPDYMPELSSMNLTGLLDIHEAIAKSGDVKMLGAVSDKLKIKDAGNIAIKNEKMDIVITDGQLWVKPFSANMGETKALIGIQRSISDMSINHTINLDMPSKGVGVGAQALGLNAGGLGDRVNIDLGVTGTTNKPKVKILGTNAGDSAKDAAKAKANEEIEKQKQKAKEEYDRKKREAEEEAARRQKELEAELAKKKEEAKKEAENKVKEEVGKKVGDELKNKFKPKW